MSDHGGEWLLRIGIPSKGRLAELAAQLLADAGLSFRRTERSLFARCKDMPVEITFLRTDDIPVLVAEGAIGLGITGADSLGDEAIAGYRKDGILTDLVVRDPDRPTGVALILVDAKGENSITVALGANEALSPEDVDRAADAVVMQLEVPLAAVERAAAIAAAAGVPVILDPAPAPDGGLPASLLQNVSCLKPNESEAERLTGIPVGDTASAERAARALQELGPRTVIVTLGVTLPPTWYQPGC